MTSRIKQRASNGIFQTHMHRSTNSLVSKSYYDSALTVTKHTGRQTEVTRRSAIQTLKKLFNGNKTLRDTPKAPPQYHQKQKPSVTAPIEARVPDVAMF